MARLDQNTWHRVHHRFLNDLTPNDAYFVRRYYAGLPARIDLRTFRLSLAGAVTRPLQLSESK